jgi:hypothetical protein
MSKLNLLAYGGIRELLRLRTWLDTKGIAHEWGDSRGCGMPVVLRPDATTDDDWWACTNEMLGHFPNILFSVPVQR